MTDRSRLNDDEALSTLLDGELPPEEAARLRERLSREPVLAERLEQLATADAALRDACAGIIEEPLPPSVLELLKTAPAGDAASGTARRTEDGGQVVELRHRRPVAPRWSSRRAAVAAGIALLVGVFLGRGMNPGNDTVPGADPVAGAGFVEPDSRLHAVLESLPSAETGELGTDLAATPRLTFRTQSGDWCRQVDVTGARGTTEVLACRRAGEWRLEVASFAPEAGAGDVYRPAAGASDAVRATVESMIADGPLEADAERALIANDWAAR